MIDGGTMAQQRTVSVRFSSSFSCWIMGNRCGGMAETGRSALDKTAVESGRRSTANALESPAAGMNWAPGRASLPVPRAEELDLC